MKNGISIIITAYKAQDYIEETLNSIENQTWFKEHNDYEIILGIDHCEDTLKKVKSIMDNYKNLTVIYMHKNEGTYITSNTLILLTKFKWILRFDSDDIMKSTMVESLFEVIDIYPKTDIVKFYYKAFSDTGNMYKNRKYGVSHGILFVNKNVYNEYGCYMPWKCGADTEFLTRLENKVVSRELLGVLFYYRIHGESLSHKEDTGMKSKLRTEYKKYISEKSASTPIIKTVVGDYEIIKNVEKTIDDDNIKDNFIIPISKKHYLSRKTKQYYGV